jgi:hypothetical protein
VTVTARTDQTPRRIECAATPTTTIETTAAMFSTTATTF